MKILLADQFSELGGAQRVLLELLPALLREGWDCTLAVPGNGLLRGRAEELGVRCEEITCGPFQSGSKSFTDMVRYGTQFYKLRKQFRGLVEDFRPEVFYVNGPRLIPSACALGGMAPPVVVHLHSYLKQRYAAVLTGYSLRRARVSVVGNCQFVLGPLRSFLDGRESAVVYNGVTDCVFRERNARCNRIGIIGRICTEKGQKVFVEAARMVGSSLPEAKFVICGSTQFSDKRSESYLDDVRRLAMGLPVEFLGWQEDVREVLHSLDLVVVASLAQAEATTRVIPEAFSAGVPVLASDLPGIREIVKEGETGFLFPSGKPGALANRMREVLGCPQVLSRVAVNARREFEERFKIEGFHRQMVGILERTADSLKAVPQKGTD